MSVSATITEFFNDPFNRYLFIGLVILGAILLFYSLPTPVQESSAPINASESNATVDFFFSPTCPHCTAQKPLLKELEREYPHVQFSYHDSSKLEEAQLFIAMLEENNMSVTTLYFPTTFIHDKAFVGFHEKEELEKGINECIETCANTTSSIGPSQEEEFNLTQYLPAFARTQIVKLIGEVNLLNIFTPILAILLGLIDGFNPCAMWVLVYLISVMANINDRKKIWLIVGSFVLASGILYFIFMAFQLNAFLMVSSPFVTLVIGLVALGGGIISLKSYIKTRGAIVCKVGDEESHRKTQNKIQEIAASPITWSIFIAIFGLAFAVNAIEFLCSFQIPLIFTHILSIRQLPMIERYFYIAIYDFFFMLDDLIIFSLAALAVTSGIGQKYVKWSKLLGGIFMLILGMLLLFAPGLLR
ncbi:thioredoxin family protein [archaeon]|nr:thioredoxin family protein [archaeon]